MHNGCITTITTTLDVTAERRRAAVLDRDHGTAVRAGQRRTVLLTKGRPEGAERVRHLGPLREA